jgi:hypothetical protein
MFTTRLTASQASLLPLPTSYVGEPIIAYYKPGVKVSESILGRALGFTLRSTDGDEIAAAVTERVFDTLLKPSVLERALAERLNEMKSNPAEAEDYARVQAFAEHLKMSSPHLVIEGSSKHD